MKQFDRRIQEIENQLDEGLKDGLLKTGKYLKKQGKALAHLPIQTAYSGGQLVKKGVDTAVDIGKGGAGFVADVGKGVVNTGKKILDDPSKIITTPLKGVANTFKDPSGTLKAATDGVKDAVTDYVPDTMKRIGGHVGDTIQSIDKAGKALASGKTIAGPNTIANLTGTKVLPGFKKDRTVLGHGLDAVGSAGSAYSNAVAAAHPANLVRNIGTNAAINTGANIVSNRLQDGINKTKTSSQDKKSTKPSL